MTYKCHGIEWFDQDTCIYCEQKEQTMDLQKAIEIVEDGGVQTERKRIAIYLFDRAKHWANHENDAIADFMVTEIHKIFKYVTDQFGEDNE